MKLIIALSLLATPAFAGDSGVWSADAAGLSFMEDGKTLKHFSFEHQQTGTSFALVSGGTCGKGTAAWLNSKYGSPDHADYRFQFFGANGDALWEKRTVVSSAVADDCGFLALLEADPKFIASNEDGNSPRKVSLYGANGQLVFPLPECSTFDEVVQLRGRYGWVHCDGGGRDRFVLLFDGEARTKKQIPGNIQVDLKADGTYVAYSEKQSQNPVTKRFGSMVRSVVERGRF